MVRFFFLLSLSSMDSGMFRQSRSGCFPKLSPAPLDVCGQHLLSGGKEGNGWRLHQAGLFSGVSLNGHYLCVLAVLGLCMRQSIR